MFALQICRAFRKAQVGDSGDKGQKRLAASHLHSRQKQARHGGIRDGFCEYVLNFW